MAVILALLGWALFIGIGLKAEPWNGNMGLYLLASILWTAFVFWIDYRLEIRR